MPATAFSHAHGTETRVAWRHRFPEAGLALAFLLMASAHAALGGMGEDESFYVSAAARVAQGEIPYADFMVPQGPVPAYAFAPAVEAFGPQAARLLGVAAGLGALLLAMSTAERMGGRTAGLVAGGVMATSLPFLLWSGSVSPLPLAAFLLAASAWVLTTRLPRPAAYALAGLLLGLAAGVRLNVAVAVPLLVLHAGLATRGPRAVLAAGLGAALTLLACYGPFLLLDADATRWSVLTYHLLDGRDPSLGLASLLKYKADGVGHLVSAFPLVVPALLLGAFLLVRRHLRDPRGLLGEDLFPAYLGLLSLAVVAVTFTKVYVQPHYLVPVLPLLAALVGLLAARLLAHLPDPRHRSALLGGVAVFLAVGLAGAAPAAVHKVPDEADLDDLRAAAAHVEARVAPGETVLTLLPAVPVLAHRDPAPGTEMGAFAYYPAMPTAQAREARVLNADLVKDALARREPAALVLTGDDFGFTPFPTARLAPAQQAATEAEIRALVEEGYDLSATFGETGGIQVWLRR